MDEKCSDSNECCVSIYEGREIVEHRCDEDRNVHGDQLIDLLLVEMLALFICCESVDHREIEVLQHWTFQWEILRENRFHCLEMLVDALARYRVAGLCEIGETLHQLRCKNHHRILIA